MRAVAMLGLVGLVQAGFQAPEPDGHGWDGLRLDQVQMIGTHNSYHQRPDEALLALLRGGKLGDGPAWPGPRLARAIDYGHEPLAIQLDRGVRALELDIRDDPQGGLYVHPPFLDTLAINGAQPDARWDPSGAMRTPGFKTIHKPAYDPRSNCPLFADCLTQIAGWSKAHADHLPIVVMIEVKNAERPRSGCAGLCDDGWRRLKQALTAAFGKTLLAPAEVGPKWPTLGSIRGRVMVMLLDEEDHARSYRAETDRDGDDIIFTAARPAKKAPLRAGRHDRIAILPNPADPRIADARRMGMLVYTRADADTEEARAKDTRRRDLAFRSGATFIATDYPSPDPRFSSYAVRFGSGFVRCDPQTGPARCQGRP